MKTTKHRNEYFDFLRGVAIIFVIALHTHPEQMNKMESFIKLLCCCAVPLFLAISGYFITSKDLASNQKRKDFWKKQIPKVYIPCLVWSLPYFVLNLAKGWNALANLFYLFFCGYGVFYFVFVIITMYLILPFIKEHCNKTVVIFFLILSLICKYIIVFYDPLSIFISGFLATLGCPLIWIGYFSLGIYLRGSAREYNCSYAVILILCGILSSIFEEKIWISTFLYSCGMILILFSKKTEDLYIRHKTFLGNIIKEIGSISFGIYLIHLQIVRYTPTENWAVKCFSTLLISSLFILLIKKILPKFSKKYLGFY